MQQPPLAAAGKPAAAPAGEQQQRGHVQQTQPQGAAAREEDCLGCRALGCLFGVGGGGYLASALLRDPPPKSAAHRYSIVAAATAMFVMGMYRALA